MKTHSLLFIFLLLCGGLLRAQTSVPIAAAQGAPTATAPSVPTVKIDMKDGTSIEATAMRRSGSSILVPLPTGAGEIGYPTSKIARINFPEPRQIAEAEALLADDKPTDALAKIEPIYAFHAPMRDIPGNFWAPAAFLKMKALLALKRSAEASTLLDQLSAASDPLIKDRVQMERAAALTRAGKDEQALPLYDDVIERSTDSETLAGAWLNKGLSLLASRKYDPALRAFLHLPVFYSSETALQPAAMLGSARAWLGLEDKEHARSALQELLDQYPRSPEAVLAEKEIQQLQ